MHICSFMQLIVKLVHTTSATLLLLQHEYEGVPVRNRRPHFFALSLPVPTFLGKDAVAWFITHKHSADRAAALRLGNSLLKHGFITHATHTRTFEDSTTCYTFAAAQCAEAQARGRGEVAGDVNSAGYSIEQSSDARGFCYNYSASNDGNSSSRFSEGRYVVESCPSSWEEGLEDDDKQQIDTTSDTAVDAVGSSGSTGSDPPLLHPVLAKTSAGEAAARASLHEQVKQQLDLQQQHLQQLQLQQQHEGAAQSSSRRSSVSSSALTL
jgi:Domain found in Dishevelled, Egl-10, and Pleckstrin (DEP)